MILTLQIHKEEPGRYAAQVLNGHAEVATFDASTIGGAIRECGAGPLPEVSAFHIWYGHVSIGTTLTATMRHDSETLAQRLMTLHGQLKS
ncbi:hypothetical protein [Acidovorax sp. NCPPB 3576]|uniref:hypothetical protein n=1 Tax=Acidovorax sp. NCPPB 3576 TaxID=2940488 RepID=UPI00234B7B6D|nr:hypothetical protein [Acidovorax sp. NCPPB 3576]WCM88862.1 hypothetical protein M5C98_02060 [Acidovorax sp. NCPPB 3576]